MAKVAIVRCDSYDQELVNNAVKNGIDLLGGIQMICKPQERILLKPNVLLGTDPNNCVVTHFTVFKAVAQLVKEYGATVLYGDSPAGLQTMSTAMQKSQLARVAGELQIEPGDFDHGKAVSFPDGICSKQLTIANAVLDSDGVISLPKLKTHGLTRMTGAIKNQYGCVPGHQKGVYHAQFPDVYKFSRLLIDINRFVKPRLYVMDAVYAMEGNGPQSGEPKKLGLLLFSTDPVALDSVACRIINLNPRFVPTIKECEDAGLGSSSEDDIEILGEPLLSCVDKGFDVVRSAPIPVPENVILNRLRKFLVDKPIIAKAKCIRCLRCVQTCPVEPVKALSCDDNQKVPVFDYNRCIRCFCCHEVCPVKAIEIKSPKIKKLFPVISYVSLFLANRHSKKNRRVVS
ncbi:MAG: DUF362 domain-containing protein [Fibrobacter sp.]|nr:DUF362 domain-containing protein [Fibrobacter sp.]